MRTILLSLIVFTLASSQELEAVIYVSDTMRGAASPTAMAFDSVRNVLYVAGTSSDYVVAVDGTTGAKKAHFPLGDLWTVSALCYRPATNKLYCFSSWAAETKVIDVAGGPVKTVPLSSPASQILYNPATNRLYAADPDRYTVDVIDCGTDSVMRTIPFDGGADAMCLSRSHNKLYLLNRSFSSISVIDALADTVLTTISVHDNPFSLCADEAGERVYCGAVNKKGLYVIDAAGDSVLALVAKGRALVALCFSPVSNRVYCADSVRDRVYIFDPVSMAFTDSAEVDNEPRWVYWSAALDRVYTANRDGRSVSVIDCATGNTTATVPVGMTPIGLAANAEGTMLYYLSTRSNGVGLIDSLNVLSAVTRFGVGPQSITGNRAGTEVYVGTEYSDSLYVVDCAANTYHGLWFSQLSTDFLQYNTARDKLYGAGGSGMVTILDAGPDTLLRQWPYDTYASACCYNPKYDKVYVGGGGPSFLAIYDGATNGVLAELKLDPSGGHVTALVCDVPTGKVYCSSENVDGLLVLDGLHNTVTDTVFELWDDGDAVAVDTGARRAYFADFAGTTGAVYVLDTDRDSLVRELVLRDYQAQLLSCDQLRHRLYCAGNDDTITVMDCLGDTVISRVATGPASALFCDDRVGRLYLTSGDDTFRVLDGSTLQPIGKVTIGGGTHHMFLDTARDRLYVTSTATSAVYVIRCGVGIAEPAAGRFPTTKAAQSVFRGPVFSLCSELEDVLDASGRRVAVLTAGKPVSLPAGVYFIVARKTGAGRRVVVVR